MYSSSNISIHQKLIKMDLRQTITISTAPLTGYTHSLILVHDRGETAATLHAWMQDTTAGQSLKRLFPTFRWVFFSSTARPSAVDGEGIDEPNNVGPLWQLLHREARRLDGRWNRIVVMGFGVGAALATEMLFNLRVPAPDSAESSGIGALIAISGQIPTAAAHIQDHEAQNSVFRSTPALLQHCADDSDVPLEEGCALRDFLRGLGVEVTWRQYVTGGHGVDAMNPVSIRDIEEFPGQVLLLGDEDGPVVMPREFQVINQHR
jgi:predicted esterase